MEGSGLTGNPPAAPVGAAARERDRAAAPGAGRERAFERAFVELFEAHFGRLCRTLTRSSGQPQLAADLAQEAFIRLYRRGKLPDVPAAWLISVAMNLLRNDRSKARRRRELLGDGRGEVAMSDPVANASDVLEAEAARWRVRRALERITERERDMLLLRAEGYGYRDIAGALGLKEASVGTLLARARRAFRAAYEDSSDAP